MGEIGKLGFGFMRLPEVEGADGSKEIDLDTLSEVRFGETALRVIEEEALIYPRQVCSIVPAALGDAIGDVAALSVAIHGREMGA